MFTSAERNLKIFIRCIEKLEQEERDIKLKYPKHPERLISTYRNLEAQRRGKKRMEIIIAGDVFTSYL